MRLTTKLMIGFVIVATFLYLIIGYNPFNKLNNFLKEDEPILLISNNYEFKSNFTEQEREVILKYTLNDLNNLYKIKNFKIIFTKEPIDTTGCDDCNKNITTGLYYPDKKEIWIKVDNIYDITQIRNTVCHEILHHYIKDSYGKKNEHNHKIVYDLAKKEVCFYNS